MSTEARGVVRRFEKTDFAVAIGEPIADQPLLDKRWLDDFELRRAQWLWEWRLALMLGEDWRVYPLVIIIALSLFLVPFREPLFQVVG